MLNKRISGVIDGLKNDFPIYRPGAVIRIKSDSAKSAKTELPPMGDISERPGTIFSDPDLFFSTICVAVLRVEDLPVKGSRA